MAAYGPRRIAILIDNLGMGGAQKLLEVQISEMQRTHDLLIVNMGQETEFAQSLARQGVKVMSQGGMRLSDVAGMSRLRRQLAQWKPDLIHSHLLYAALVGSALARLLKVPHVTTLHNEKHAFTGVRDRLRAALEQHVLRHMTSVVIACGPRIALLQAGRVGKTPLVTVANRVQPARALTEAARAEKRRAAGIAPTDVVLLAAGRLMPQKGFDILIEAFALVAASSPQALVLIAGEGPDRAALESQIKTHALENRVRLIGEVRDMQDMLQIADAFVLSSRHEGLPLVLIEALSAGLPIVATRVGDVETVMDDTCGIIVAPGEVEPLALALETMAGSGPLRQTKGQAAAQAGQVHTDVAGFVAELTAVYDKAAGLYDAAG